MQGFPSSSEHAASCRRVLSQREAAQPLPAVPHAACVAPHERVVHTRSKCAHNVPPAVLPPQPGLGQPLLLLKNCIK